jgi:hydrophobic/amphiphilic exporter-1 (mainly G- bacteria), HAE1 family
MNIANISINRPVFVVMIVVSILTLGIIGYNSLPVDLLPNVDFPNLTVVSVYPGSSAEEMETQITKPIENALGTVEGLDTLSSVTREGVSTVSISFKMGTDLKFAELKVREKVQGIMPQLPQDIAEPTIRKFSSDDIPILYLSLKGKKELWELKDIVKNDIQPKIEVLEGVGSMQIFGGQDKIIRIAINKSLLTANGITYNQISSAINRRNISYPIGSIKGEEKNMTVRVYGKAASVDDIGNIKLTAMNGKVLRIKDIANVEFALEDETSRTRVKGENSVLFAVYKQSGGNTIKVADNVKKAIDPNFTTMPAFLLNALKYLNVIKKDRPLNIVKLNLPNDVSLEVVSDSSKTIRQNVNGVRDDILFGAFLAIIIVWLFLGNIRSTLITAIALPNSLLGAFFLVNLAGFSVNIMTLLALSLSVGLLIDDSIVVRENIFRHIELGMDPKSAASKGTNEVALAVLSTTLSILAVFIPISFLKGVVGQFFREFGLTVAFALMISLVDAFTSAPMLSAYWYKKAVEGGNEKQNIFTKLSKIWNSLYDEINKIYRQILTWALNHKLIAILSTAILFVAILASARFIGQNFMNNADGGGFTINMETYPGAPLDKIDTYVRKTENFLNGQKEIDTFFSMLGQSQSHSASITVIMKDLKKRKHPTSYMINLTREYIKANFDKNINYTLIEASFMGGSSGGGGAISINVFGEDLDELEALSKKMKKVISETPGTTDVNTSIKNTTPELILKLDDIKAEEVGISAAELGSILRDLVEGSKISTFTKGNNDYDIIIRLDENQRKTIDDFKNFTVTTRTGKKILLSSICSFNYSSAPLEIRRENNQRVVRITGSIRDGFSLTNVISNLKKNLSEKIVVPSGYSYEFVGAQKDFVDLVSQMILAMLLAVLFMYMILASLYNSFIQPLILMLSIPLAIIGSFLALLFTGIDLDVYGYIGILLVLGLVAKNAILVIDFANKRRREEGFSIRDALLDAGPIRLRPILMTTFALIFGMLPLALGLNEGSVGRQALPVTVIGGLLTSTFLTLVVIPVVYELIETSLEKRRNAKKSRNKTEITGESPL